MEEGKTSNFHLIISSGKVISKTSQTSLLKALIRKRNAFCSQIQNLKRLKKGRVIKSTRESNYLETNYPNYLMTLYWFIRTCVHATEQNSKNVK